MSTNYIVTAQKPTAVTACVTGKIEYFLFFIHIVQMHKFRSQWHLRTL